MKYLSYLSDLSSQPLWLWQNASPEKNETATEKPVNELEEADIQAETVEAYTEKVKQWLENPENIKNLTVRDVRTAFRSGAEKFGEDVFSLSHQVLSDVQQECLWVLPREDLAWQGFLQQIEEIENFQISMKKVITPMLPASILIRLDRQTALIDISKDSETYSLVAKDKAFLTYGNGSPAPLRYFFEAVREYSKEYKLCKTDKAFIAFCKTGQDIGSFLYAIAAHQEAYAQYKHDENFLSVCGTDFSSGFIIRFLLMVEEFPKEYEQYKHDPNLIAVCKNRGNVRSFLKQIIAAPATYERYKDDQTLALVCNNKWAKAEGLLRGIGKHQSTYEKYKDDPGFRAACLNKGVSHVFLSALVGYSEVYELYKDDPNLVAFCKKSKYISFFLKAVDDYRDQYRQHKDDLSFKFLCERGYQINRLLQIIKDHPDEYEQHKDDPNLVYFCENENRFNRFIQIKNVYQVEYKICKDDRAFKSICELKNDVRIFFEAMRAYPEQYAKYRNDDNFIQICTGWKEVRILNFLALVQDYPTEYDEYKDDQNLINIARDEDGAIDVFVRTVMAHTETYEKHKDDVVLKKFCERYSSVGTISSIIEDYSIEYEKYRNDLGLIALCTAGENVREFFEAVKRFSNEYDTYKNHPGLLLVSEKVSDLAVFLRGVKSFVTENPRNMTKSDLELFLLTLGQKIPVSSPGLVYLEVFRPDIVAREEDVAWLLDNMKSVQEGTDTMEADPMAAKAMIDEFLSDAIYSTVRGLNQWQNEETGEAIPAETRVEGVKGFSAENLYWLMTIGLQEFTGSSSFGLVFDGYGQLDGRRGRMRRRAKNGEFVPFIYQIQMSGKTGSEFLQSVDPSGSHTNDFLILLASRGYLEKFFLLTNTPEAEQNKLFEGLVDSVSESKRPMEQIIVLREIIQGLNNDTERSIDSVLLDEVMINANEGKGGIFGLFKNKEKQVAKAELLKILNETKLRILQTIETKMIESYKNLKKDYEGKAGRLGYTEKEKIRDQIDALAIFMALYQPGSGEAISETSSLALQEMQTIKEGFEKMLGYSLDNFEVKEQSEKFLFRNDVCVNVGLMYDNKDGAGNFASFPRTMKAQGWTVKVPKGYKRQKDAPFIIIEKSNNDKANPRKIVHLIENPKFSGKGIDAMKKYCEEHKLYLNEQGELDPTISTHFGHAGDDARTKNQITRHFDNVNFNINRACWGDHLKSEWIDYNPLLHSFGTKGTGTRQVGDPCMLVHSEMALEKGKVDMEDWWETMEIIFETKPEPYKGQRKELLRQYNLKRPSKFAREKFLSYIPPHEDQSMRVLRLKNTIEKKREDTREEFPYDPIEIDKE